MVSIPLCYPPHAYGQSLTMYRALHMGGHWGRNPSGIPEQPRQYYDFLRSLGVNWVGISIGLHVGSSVDSTVERVYTDPGVPGFIPTFRDEQIINAIRGFKRNNIDVSLNLCFETAEAGVSQYPLVHRTDLGDPTVPTRESSVRPENWPWDPAHPNYQSFVNSFWRTYTSQAVHFARIAQAEGAGMFVIGAENDRLFRTRAGGPFVNDFRTQIKAMVDSVRRVFSGFVSYELHWGALADAQTFGPGSDYLWDDTGLDIVGVSAYFQLAPSAPTSVMPVSMLEPNWEDAFTRFIIPLKNRNPNKPLLFLEFGYVDVVGSPFFADQDCFSTRVFRDVDQNGKDDGEETQANIHEAFFKVNERHNRLVQGVFLWGNDVSSNTDWQLTFGQQRTHSVRNKLAAQVVKDYYVLFTPAPQIPVLASPVSGAQNVPLGPTFVWRMAQDASTYTVQVADGADFVSLKVDSTGIPDTSITIQNLQSQKMYFWRVRSKNNADSSAWSTASSFTTTVAAPSQPALLSPVPDASGVPHQPTLSWSASAGAATYHVQVSTQPGFSPLVVNDSSVITTSTTVGPLAAGTKHYWKVRAKNTAGTSPWSVTSTFTTLTAAPATPSLLTPAPDAVGVPLQTTLSWSASGGATSYRLQLSTQPGFSPLVVDDSTVTSTSRAVGPLVEGTKYYWRVNAKSAGGTSPWATVATFTTLAATLAVPNPLTPISGAVGVQIQPTLTWSVSTGATSYRLQLSMQSGFGVLVLDDSTLTSTSRVIGPLAEGALYYWRVQSKNASGKSAWSAAATFTTVVTSLTSPTPQSPADGSTGVPTFTTLSWSASPGAVSYRLQLSTQLDFAALVLDDSSLTTTSRAVGPLTEGTLYRWRVRAKSAGSSSPWSVIAQFTTAILPPTPPSLLAPPHGAAGVPLQPTLTWAASINGQSYRLQVSTNQTFVPLVLEDSTLAATSRVVGPLTAGTLYHWRVRSKNVGGTGPWSAVFSFTTQTASAVEWLGDLNITEFQLHYSYPNPFNPATVLSYQIPEACYVYLSVYDALGLEVAALVKGQQLRGLYRMGFSGRDLPSGVYFVRMQAGVFSAINKIVLLR